MTVFDLLESLFADCQRQRRLSSAWHLDIGDPGIYPRRSLTTQHEESDLAFLGRLMAEEGLFHSQRRGHQPRPR